MENIKYTLQSLNDPLLNYKLTSNKLEDAALEALEMLGWQICWHEEEEEEQSNEAGS